MIAARWRAAVYGTAFLCAGLALAILGDGYAFRIATLVGIYAVAAIGFQLVFGRLGLLALSQGAFFGVGAYALALATVELGLAPLFGLLVAILVPALLAGLVALPVARLESHYVALATLGLAQLALLTATNLDITGGANGLYGVPSLAVFGFDLSGGWALLLIVWGGVALALALAGWVTAGTRGARLATLRDAPLTAPTLGLDPVGWRIGMFALAGGLAGLAGGLQALDLGVVSPAVLRFEVMVTLLAIAVVGGRGSGVGAVVGAAVLVPLPELFRGFESGYLIAYGVAMLVAIVLLPRGLAGALARVFPRSPPSLPRSGTVPPRLGVSLRVEGLGRRFGGVVALDGVGFEVPSGRIVGLIGANGSGKTTALNRVSGLDRAGEGQVWLGKTRIDGLSPVRRARLGLARGFQHPEIPNDLYVFEVVLAAAPSGEVAMGALDRVGLGDAARTWADALGPAARRRLDLARALATGPSVLLLDEPAAGLTAEERDRLATLLRGLAGEGRAVLVVEHSMDFLLPLADRIVCLDAGRVIAEGPPDVVAADPAVRAAYLGREAVA